MSWPSRPWPAIAAATAASCETLRKSCIPVGLSQLPESVRALADKNFALLKSDPRHPSLHFKQIGRYFSVRVGLRYRALAVEADDGLLWFWIGSHADYDALLKS